MKLFRPLVGSLFSLLFIAISCAPRNVAIFKASQLIEPPKHICEDLICALPSGDTLKMIYVKGGTFYMGATPEQDEYARLDEYPAPSVTLSDFYIAELEVTQKLWTAVMGTTIEEQRDLHDASYLCGKGDSYPMYYISYTECLQFMTKLNILLERDLPSGFTFSLPTEAQWEYAARGGSKRKIALYSGSDNIDKVAWYSDNNYRSPYMVGALQPNELGIYDMSGNLWEWCLDFYDKSYYSVAPQNNPVNLESSPFRVLRGGSWFDDASDCRVAMRGKNKPSNSSVLNGMRIALVQ